MPLTYPPAYTGRALPAQHADPWFDVTAYGACDKSGGVSSGPAFAAAVAALIASPRGGTLFIPSGVYLVPTGTMDFSASGNPVDIRGAGRGSTVIIATTTTGDYIKFSATADGCSVRDLTLWSNSPQTAGAGIHTNGVDDLMIDNCSFNNLWQDIFVDNSSIKVSITHTAHFQTNGSATSVGIQVTNGAAGDTYIGPDVVMSNTGATRRAASVAITQSGHFEINQTNLTGSAQGLLINPGAGQIVAFGFINESLFDSCTVNGATISAPTSTSTVKSLCFTDAWFAGTITGTGGAGLVTSGVAGGIIDGLNFSQCRWLNNQTHGFQHGYGTDIWLIDAIVRGNSQAGANANDGINIAANLGTFTVVGGKIGGTDAAGTGGNQRWGINILAGTGTDWTITDCDLIGNQSGGISDNSTGTRKQITGNVGMPLPASPRVAATAGINTTETIIAQMNIPLGGLMPGATYKAVFLGQCTSTGANVSTFRLRYGTAGTTADAVVATLTCTAAASGTAVPFECDLFITVRTIGSSGTTAAMGVLFNNGVTGVSNAAVVVNPTSAVATSTINTTVANFLTATYVSAASTTTSTFHISFIEVKP
jgi:hypothetical protein